MEDEEDITEEDIPEEEDEEVEIPENPKIANGLRLLEEEFCKAYTSHDRDIFGNGVQCYLAIYGPQYLLKYKKYMSYRAAGVLAHKLLKRVKIINRINGLLEEGGFNDQNVDKQHLFLINQHADLKTKLGGIKEYNALKKRIDNPLQGVVILDPSKKEEFSKALEYLHGPKSNP